MNKVLTFIKALYHHIKHGMPKASQDKINYRYNICLQCESYDAISSQCLECGCNISNQKIFMNKLAWHDQKCPLEKWK